MKRNIGMKVIEPVHCKKYATHLNRPRISGILLILRTNSMEADFLKLKRVIKQMSKLSWKITLSWLLFNCHLSLGNKLIDHHSSHLDNDATPTIKLGLLFMVKLNYDVYHKEGTDFFLTMAHKPKSFSPRGFLNEEGGYVLPVSGFNSNAILSNA